MNVLLLQGSPRRDGNTATLARAAIEGMGPGAKVTEVFLHGKSIHPCAACDGCRRREGIFCVQKDDMQPLYRQVMESDLLLVASPVYWWNLSAQTKLVIDRLYGLNPEKHPERLRGKRVAVILSHGDTKPCSGAKIALKMLGEICDYTEMELAGTLEHSSADGHASGDPRALAAAKALGRKLAKTT
jgi:multimeric flavodoxin WrbA